MEETEVIAIKIRFRKNIRGGCVLIRPCLCAETQEKARLICPVHTCWPLVAGEFGVNKPIFANLHANSVNQQLKAVVVKLRYYMRRRYSSHAIRRGPTEEIKNSGSTCETITKSGTWAAEWYKSCIGLQADAAINISKLPLDAVNSDSNDTEPESLPIEQKL